MTIAVVIPVYNVAPYLKRCLDSVLAAAEKVEKRGGGGQGTDSISVEIVCVDDGSTDGSGAILDAYAEQLKSSTSTPNLDFKVIRQANAGPSAARNAALDLLEREKSATHVAFVDSDDWVAPGYFVELVRGLADGAEISAVLCRRTEEEAVDWPSDGEVRWRNVSPRTYWADGDSNQAVAWGKLYALRLFEGIRYPVGRINEDECTTYRVFFRAGKVATASARLYAYRKRPGSIMNVRWSAKRLDRLQAWRDQIGFFGERGYAELVANSRRGLTVDLVDAVHNLKALGEEALAETCRRELAEELKAGRCGFRDYYLAYKTAHPLRTRIMKMLGMA